MEKQGELMGVHSGLKTITAFVGPLVYNNLFTYYTTGDPWLPRILVLPSPAPSLLSAHSL